jgi:CheY-like chemotaxis protein
VDLHAHVKDGCVVRGSRSAILEAVVNLIRNAVEALPEGGDIFISSRVEGGRVVMEIRDTGVGMSEEDLNHVFNPFYTRKAQMGAGLGLAMARAVLNECGGAIEVAASPGKGSKFTVSLPYTGSTPPPAADPPTEVPRRTEAFSVLVVHDVGPIAELLSRSLGKVGYIVRTASSGTEALALFEECPSSVVVCDLLLPGMDGRRTARALRDFCEEKNIPKPPFVLLSDWGHGPEDDRLDAKSGVDAWLAKPIQMDDLIRCIQSLL